MLLSWSRVVNTWARRLRTTSLPWCDDAYSDQAQKCPLPFTSPPSVSVSFRQLDNHLIIASLVSHQNPGCLLDLKRNKADRATVLRCYSESWISTESDCGVLPVYHALVPRIQLPRRPVLSQGSALLSYYPTARSFLCSEFKFDLHALSLKPRSTATTDASSTHSTTIRSFHFSRSAQTRAPMLLLILCEDSAELTAMTTN